MTQGDDQRLHPRVIAVEPAELAPADGPAAPCVLEDLSLGGARVTAGAWIPPGRQVALSLCDGPPLAARIVYHFAAAGGAFGYGLAFLPAAHALAAHALARRAGGRPRLLVVHSEAATCRALVRDLAAAGASAAAAHTARAGRQLVDQLAPHLAHVLLEAQLAEVDETDLLDHLARVHPNVGRVLLCDPAAPPMVIRRRPAPACMTWRPPWSPVDLGRLLQSLPSATASAAPPTGPGGPQATRE